MRAEPLNEISALLEELDACQEDGSTRSALLIRLLVEEGHDRHEDIVFELGLIGDSAAVPAIAKAVHMPFPELVRWHNLHAFQRKCAYALARIGTEDSRRVLEELAADEDEYLREYGKEGLEHWPMPFKE
ncbi:HEAT repeat domain-containing protein [Variovorax sp. DAIF25]|uniref:HEAT repeat domain-containing protein n=1 Tax=Variovorax sp. DAIF25 TaxID=3080983 RepID=UPI003D6B7BF4